MPFKNIRPSSFSRFFLHHGNILQQFIIKYLFSLLRGAYANFQIERTSKIMFMLIFVVLAYVQNTHTRFPWLFDPVISFPGSWYVGNLLPGVYWLKISAIVSLNNAIKSICWSSKGRSQNMTLSRPWESWETSGSASAELFWQKVTKPDPKNWRKPRKHFVVSYSASGIRFSGSQQSPCQSITNLIPVVFYFEEPQAFLMDIICSINNGEVLGQVI